MPLDDPLSLQTLQPESIGTWEPMIRQVRDVTYVGLDSDRLLVIACDSSGGVGAKPNDVGDWSFREAGFGAAKVALMEVIATGASPFLVVDNLCVEMDPSGNEILAGIREAMALLPVTPALTGSDEVNIPTVQTGIGITVLGVVDRAACRTGRAESDDKLIAIGEPMGASGGPRKDSDPRAASVITVLELLRMPGVREVLPVGSRGIRYEAEQMAGTAGLELELLPNPGVDTSCSGGTSTTVVVAADPSIVPRIPSATGLPAWVIASLS